LSVKAYFEDLMYGRKKSRLLGPALSAVSLMYGAAVFARNALYRLGTLKSRKLSCRVISIGNLTLGGTGKTPMVIAVAGLLSENRKHPAVISRGYGRQDEAKILVVSDGQSLLVDARTGGDEPVLIGSKLSGVPVVVGNKRYEAAQFVLKRFHPDIVILDDGFQHLKLRRDLDIVLVDAADPFGNGKLFPAGILREPVTALRRAHAVVITRADASGSVEELRENIRRISVAPVFTSFHRPVDLVADRISGFKPLSVLRGTRVLALSGIARPASFLSLLTSLGAFIAAECAYPDHHDYKKSDLVEVFQKAADHAADMIVTTEKDAIRLRELKPDGIWALRIELSVVEREEWESFLLNSL
jgi:tetraacyldisaccharide 4'-kinase